MQDAMLPSRNRAVHAAHPRTSPPEAADMEPGPTGPPRPPPLGRHPRHARPSRCSVPSPWWPGRPSSAARWRPERNPDRRRVTAPAARDASPSNPDTTAMARPNSTSLFSAALVGPGARRRRHQARPAQDDQEPGHVRGRGRRRAHHRPVRARRPDRGRQPRLLRPDHPLAVVHRAVRQLRRGHRRRARQGPGRQPAAHPHRDHGQAPEGHGPGLRDHPRQRPQGRRRGPGRGRRHHPSDGEVILGVASVNEAAITGESAP